MLSEDLTAILVIVALGCVLLLAVAVTILAVRLRRVRREQAAGGEDRPHREAFGANREHVEELRALRTDLGVVHENTEVLRELVRDAVTRVAVVRYDAFEDMGGALSFSAALLDERGDGVVVSAINGRSETRTYAKSVEGGSSEHHLSDEEAAAIRHALASTTKTATTVAPGGRRRRRVG